MPSQKTDRHTIEDEKRIVKDIAKLTSLDDITLIDRGWDSRVYSFDCGRYFFKFPRSEKIQGRYQYEIAAIKFLADLDTRIVAQKILWEHPENAYFGYEGVQGVAVSEIMGTLKPGQKQLIGEALGDFLKQFHKLKLPGARTMTLDDEAHQIQRWFANCRQVVRTRFSVSEQQQLEELVYQIWPAKLAELGSESVLSHGDLHFENILYGNNGKIGIIDFGDVAYFDRSKDFLELENDEAIFKAVLEVYGRPDPHLIEKIALRQSMIQIINLGFHAGKEDTANIKVSVERIRSAL
jgi:aminoglycoside phosphotransferase (APT) family kinase protein